MRFQTRLAVLLIIPAALVCASLSSCARMEKRAPRYSEKACPFCTQKTGVCMYCEGNAKCTYCQGTGKRLTVSPPVPEDEIQGGKYTESCPFCKGTGKCRYCEGSAKCWSCSGSGQAGDWDFYERYRKFIAATKDSVALSLTQKPPVAESPAQ